MENVLSAIVVFFLLLFSVLTLSGAFMNAQITMQDAWKRMAQRIDAQQRTALEFVDAEVVNSGTRLDLVLRNSGQTAQADFDRWDVIAQYDDSTAGTARQVAWLPFSSSLGIGQTWSVEGIYLDDALTQPEAFERTLLNSGEIVQLRLELPSAVGIGLPIQTTVSTDNGVTVSATTLRNIPPILAVNLPLTVNAGATAAITDSLLSTTDADDLPDDLVYTVTTAPARGTLSLGSTFTQAQIDGGLLTYAHGGGVDGDTFVFSVSDGVDTIGTFTFTINVNQPPALAANAGMTMVQNSTQGITSAMLAVTDSDNAASELIYTILIPTTQGLLSYGPTFTQAEIDNGMLVYQHTGVGHDSFRFTVSDGNAEIGPFNFLITVLSPTPTPSPTPATP